MNKKQLLDFSERYAEANGFKLNPDKETMSRILDVLLENEKKAGFRFCPCKIHLKANICPCVDNKKEIAEMGHCTCTLFWKA